MNCTECKLARSVKLVTVETSGTRRELNKQATRTAIVAATLELLRTGGREATTASAIAEAAGISRRTLFNYFPTVDAIMAEPMRRLLDKVVESLLDADPHLHPLTAAIQALRSAGVPELLAPVAQLNLHAKACGLPLADGQSNEWQHASDDVVHAIERLSPEVDPFEIRIFAHTVLGAGQAAFEEWTHRLAAQSPDHRSTPLELSSAHIRLLHSLITHALEQLSEGFPALLRTADPTHKDQ